MEKILSHKKTRKINMCVHVQAYTVYHEVSRQKSFMVFVLFACSRSYLICKFKMALFIYGFKRKYEGLCERFFTKVCVYNLAQNFSALKLVYSTWYMHV